MTDKQTMMVSAENARIARENEQLRAQLAAQRRWADEGGARIMLLTIGKCILMAVAIWWGILACAFMTVIVLDEMREIKNKRKWRK